jgi:hypothetical protein
MRRLAGMKPAWLRGPFIQCEEATAFTHETTLIYMQNFRSSLDEPGGSPFA